MEQVYCHIFYESQCRSTKIHYQMIPLRDSSFHFTVGPLESNSRVILVACTLRTRNVPQIFCDVGRRFTAQQITLRSSQADSDDRLLSHVTLGRVECGK